MSQITIEKTTTPLSAPQRVYAPVGTSLADIALKTHPAVNDNTAQGEALRKHLVIRLAGQDIPRDNWAKIKPKPGVEVQVGLRVGSGVKQIFQTVLTVFIAVTLTYFGVPPNIAWTVASTVSALIANALIKPPKVDRGDQSRYYTIEGGRNQLVQLNEPAPLILGEHRFVPRFLAPPIQDLVGEDLYLICALLWAGHDIDLTEFKIGDTDITSFEGVAVKHSLRATDPAPTLYPGAVGVTSVGTELAKDAGDPVTTPGPWVTATTPPNAETIKLLGAFPRGLGWLKNGQEKRAITRGFEIQYRAVGDTDWQTSSAATIIEGDQAAVNLGGDNRRGLIGSVIADLTQYVAEVNASQGGGSVDLSPDFTRSDMKPFYWEVEFAVPSGPQYEVRMRKKAQERNLGDDAFDEIRWEVMQTYTDKEISPDPRLAVTHVRVKASDQLNGFIDSFNGIVKPYHGVHVPPADPADTAPSDFAAIGLSRNPADQLLFLAQGDHNVVKTPDEEIDFSSYSAFWTRCLNENYTCDIVITGEMRRDEAEDIVAGCGRARVIRRAGKKTIIMDEPNLPLSGALASSANAWDFEFEKVLPPDVHALRIGFQNKNIGYRQDQLFVYAPGYDAQTATIIDRMSLPGRVTSADIVRDGTYFLRTAQLIGWRGSFMMDIEHLTFDVGKRCRIVHYQARNVVESVVEVKALDITGSTLNAVTLDRPLELGAENYGISWRRVTGTDPNAKIEILGPFPITEQNAVTDIATITAGLPDSQAPDIGDKVWISPISATEFDGVIQAIEPGEDLTARIFWSEYSPQRHTDADGASDTHVDPTPEPFAALPPSPVFSAISAGPDAIYVSFTYPPDIARTLRRFRVAFRETPNAGASAGWTDLPDLLPVARTLALPPGIPGENYDARIIAELTDGRSSEPLIVSNIAPFDRIPVPVNPVVTPVITPGTGGRPGTPIVRVAVDLEDLDGDPLNNPARLDSLVVESRISDIGGGTPGPWRVNTTSPAESPEKTLSRVEAGNVIDLRFAWKMKNGLMTLEANRPIVSAVTIPDPVGDVTTGLSDNLDNILTGGGGAGLSVTINPTQVEGSGPPGETVITNSMSVSISGGTAPYQISWSETSSFGVTPGAPNSNSTNWSGSTLFQSGQNYTADVQVTVTDSAGTPVTVTASGTVKISTV